MQSGSVPQPASGIRNEFLFICSWISVLPCSHLLFVFSICTEFHQFHLILDWMTLFLSCPVPNNNHPLFRRSTLLGRSRAWEGCWTSTYSREPLQSGQACQCYWVYAGPCGMFLMFFKYIYTPIKWETLASLLEHYIHTFCTIVHTVICCNIHAAMFCSVKHDCEKVCSQLLHVNIVRRVMEHAFFTTWECFARSKNKQWS